MFSICKPEKIAISILGKQPIKRNNYRPLFYTHMVNYNHGYIIANILTKEKIWISEDEKIFFAETKDINNDIVRDLIEKWFLVPTNFDDQSNVNNTIELKKLYLSAHKKDYLNNFVIFTTTDCNARCHYCYEKGSRRINMSEKTASDVAHFIIDKSKNNDISIEWFGGEPLYNFKAIDIICNILKKNKVSFKSIMISNGYLFDDTIIEKSVNDWNLNSVQVTLDGTEEVYNKIKSYICHDLISPFMRVIENIEKLLNSSIEVKIRLNFDKNNVKDIDKLVDLLIDKFIKYDNCKIYAVPINYYNKNEVFNIENRKFLYDAQNKIMDKIYANNMNEPKTLLRNKSTLIHCMADNDNSTTILPDGKLGKCEYYLDDNYWGDIYNNVIDYEIIESFKILKNELPQCKNCKWRLECGSLEKCRELLGFCDDLEIKNKEDAVRRSLIKEYNTWLFTHNDADDGSVC